MLEKIPNTDTMRHLTPGVAADYVQFKSEALVTAIKEYVETHHHAYDYTESGRFDYAAKLALQADAIESVLRDECQVMLDGTVEEFIAAYTAHTDHPFQPLPKAA